VATSTVAKSLDPYPLLAEILPPQARLRYAKRQPEFRVFPTGSAEYHWRVVALATSRTISRHKSLALALRKCTWLNKHPGKAQLDSLRITFSRFPNANTHRANKEGVGSNVA